MRDVVILGVGLHKFGRFPEKGLGDFARVAALAALKDAGVDYKDIEAGFCGRVYDRVNAGLRTFGELGLTGIPITNVELACASSSRAAMLAADAIAGGIYDLVLVIGAEKMARGMLGGGEMEPSYQMLMGLFIMPGAYAQMAQRHMYEYGTKPEHFAQVSVKSHKNAVHNPNAHYQAPLSLEEVMNSRMVADPITLYQCCPTSDGASAVVLASAEKARQYTSTPIYLKSWYGGTPMYKDGEVDIMEGPTAMLGQKCYDKAGVGPEDIDVAQVHDAFSPGEIFTIEDLRFCPKGEGGPFVWEGNTEITGKIPVNTDGGLLSRGHPLGATGGAMIAELTWQLRGQAGARQVEGAKTALLENAGVGGLNVMIFQR
jgi:acetyl-CoA acetyltransferase